MLDLQYAPQMRIDPPAAPDIPLNVQQYQMYPGPGLNPEDGLAYLNPHEGLRNANAVDVLNFMDGGALGDL